MKKDEADATELVDKRTRTLEDQIIRLMAASDKALKSELSR